MDGHTGGQGLARPSIVVCVVEGNCLLYESARNFLGLPNNLDLIGMLLWARNSLVYKLVNSQSDQDDGPEIATRSKQESVRILRSTTKIIIIKTCEILPVFGPQNWTRCATRDGANCFVERKQYDNPQCLSFLSCSQNKSCQLPRDEEHLFTYVQSSTHHLPQMRWATTPSDDEHTKFTFSCPLDSPSVSPIIHLSVCGRSCSSYVVNITWYGTTPTVLMDACSSSSLRGWQINTTWLDTKGKW